MAIIKIKNLTVGFTVYKNKLPSFKDYILSFLSKKKESSTLNFKALDNISLNIVEGEKVGIIGHNGAGKSTLLKTICRIYEPEVGEVFTTGKIAPLLEIGAGFHPEYTGKENIDLNGTLLGYEKSAIKKFENKIIDFAELKTFINMPVKYYSTGMLLKLGFSIATVSNPDILIMDEMFAGSDKDFQKKASKRIDKMMKDTSILILVSHDLELIKKFCSRVIWIENGKIKDDGKTGQILKRYR